MYTIIYVDGQNFLYKVAERLIAANLISDKQDITSFDFRGLFSPMFPGQPLEIRYYGVRRISTKSAILDAEMQEKANHYADGLRRLKSYLIKNGVRYVPKGSLKVRSADQCKNCGYESFKFQEKGVDVGLAIDLVQDALVGEAHHIALASSDADLLPALQIVRRQGVYVNYIAFSDQATTSLAKEASFVLTLSDPALCKAYVDSLN